jgi:hypothetical protein
MMYFKVQIIGDLKDPHLKKKINNSNKIKVHPVQNKLTLESAD